MATLIEQDDTLLEDELIEEYEDLMTDWLESWTLTDFADLIDQQLQEMSGVEVYHSRLTELAG